MGVTWKYVKSLNDANSVRDYLRKCGVVLPDALIVLLEENNGGRPSDKTIVTSDGNEHVFKSLYSYNDGDRDSVYPIYSQLFKATSLYPIASDSAGNIVCYDCEKEKYILYNHESNETEVITEICFIS